MIEIGRAPVLEGRFAHKSTTAVPWAAEFRLLNKRMSCSFSWLPPPQFLGYTEEVQLAMVRAKVFRTLLAPHSEQVTQRADTTYHAMGTTKWKETKLEYRKWFRRVAKANGYDASQIDVLLGRSPG